jgi:hypothetical protein
MYRRLLPVAGLLAALVLVPRPATAGFGLGLSAGEGLNLYKGPDAERTRFSLEVTPSLGFSILRVDLALHFDLDRWADGRNDRSFGFELRPGIRIVIPFFYARAAIPLRIVNGSSAAFDWGFLLGLGSEFFRVGPLALFLEADTFFSQQRSWTNPVVLDSRFGLLFYF